MLLNAVQRKPLYKICIWSAPGKGKTHIGATAPKPLILLFERHGFETVRTASKMTGRPMPPVIWVRSIGQLGRIRSILASRSDEPIADMMRDEEIVPDTVLEMVGTTRDELVSSLPYLKPETVVVDSMTEACEMVAHSVDSHGGTETKDGLTFRKLRAWGPISDKCTAVIRSFRDLPFHVLFLALNDERDMGTEESPDVHHRPALPGRKLWKVLLASVNACGVVVLRRSKNEETGKVKTSRYVQFVTSNNIATKCASPLRDREPANAGAWFAALEHGVASKSTQQEMESMGVVLPDLDDSEDEAAGEEE